MVIAFKERIRFSRVIGLSLPKYEALWRYCAIAAIKQILHKVHKKKMKIIKTLKIRHFGAKYISVPFFANIRISLKKSQQKVTSSKNCVFDKFWQDISC